MTNTPVDVLRESGAWHEGHTEFRSGFHGSGWLEKDLIVRNPVYLDRICKLQADSLRREFAGVDLIIGPITGGALIASSVARYLGKEIGIILGKQDPILFHSMNVPEKGEEIVIVDDIISSGVDMKRFLGFTSQSGARILGVSVWMNRGNTQIDGTKIVGLMDSGYELYEKERCPICLEGVDLRYRDIRE